MQLNLVMEMRDKPGLFLAPYRLLKLVISLLHALSGFFNVKLYTLKLLTLVVDKYCQVLEHVQQLMHASLERLEFLSAPRRLVSDTPLRHTVLGTTAYPCTLRHLGIRCLNVRMSLRAPDGILRKH